MTQLTLESMRQYREAGVFTESGGIEVARTEERMEELRRRMASAKSWGVDGVSARHARRGQGARPVHRRVGDPRRLLHAVGRASSTRCASGRSCASAAQELGALQVFPNTEVLGIDIEDGRVKRVRTDRGDVETDVVVVACGVWSPRIAKMAGASIPLTPAVHQMIDVGPVPRFLGSKTSIEFPIVRDMDTNMYERQDGQGLEVGSYAHRPILSEPDDIPSIAEAALSPTELPFTQEDFELQLEHALQLVPEILGDESVGIKYAINGLLSLTPDGLPLLGETPEVKGLWSAAAVWVKEGPGVGKSLAEWMVHGESEIDLQSSDVARFYDEQRTPAHVKGRAAEGFNKTYGIVHPSEQWESNRRVRMSPFYAREQELGARLLRGGGVGAAAVVRVECEARRGVRRAGARARVGRALVVADRQRRASRDARACRDVRPDGVLHLRRRRSRRAGRRAAGRRPADGRADRPRGLHAGALAARNLQVRPDDHAHGRRASSASSPAAHTGWPTRSGSPTT